MMGTGVPCTLELLGKCQGISLCLERVNLAGILGTQEQIQKHGWGRRVGFTGGGA